MKDEETIQERGKRSFKEGVLNEWRVKRKM
jgi:hypothetical protein